MIIQTATITIYVKDMDASVSCYASLGLTIKHRWGDHYAELEAPGLTIGLHPANNNQPSGNAGHISIGFTTDNLEAARSMLQQLSIAVTDRTEEGGQFLHFHAPEGTALYFISPKQ